LGAFRIDGQDLGDLTRGPLPAFFGSPISGRPAHVSLSLPPSWWPQTESVMADTDAQTRRGEHFSEEDWFDFAHQQAAPFVRARLERHLEKGCSRCTQTVRLWRAVLDVADQEAAYRPPD